MSVSINMQSLFEISTPTHSPLFAVCYGYCAETGLTPQLIEAEKQGQIIPFCLAHNLPVIVGIDTVSCEQWAALTNE